MFLSIICVSGDPSKRPCLGEVFVIKKIVIGHIHCTIPQSCLLSIIQCMCLYIHICVCVCACACMYAYKNEIRSL